MLRVGLTGGIACGKSFTLKEFEKLGVYGIDADKISHMVTGKGGSAYPEVVAAFGREIVGDDGEIDRKKLGKLVFSDDESRRKLMSIVHPHIFAEEKRRLEALENPLSNVRPRIAMTDAALMVETGSHKRYDYVIVVYCRQEIQIRRMLYRDLISEEEAQQRIDSQMPVLEKVKYADFIVENSGTLAHTREQIRQIYAELLSRAEE